MAVIVYTDGYIVVNAVNLSSRCVELTVDDGYDEVDVKAMSNTAGNTTVGMKNQMITAKFIQDYAASNVHATLNAAQGTGVTVAARPTSGAKATTNPEWSGTLILTKYQPIGAKVGDKQIVTAQFKTQGTALTYATS